MHIDNLEVLYFLYADAMGAIKKLQGGAQWSRKPILITFKVSNHGHGGELRSGMSNPGSN